MKILQLLALVVSEAVTSKMLRKQRGRLSRQNVAQMLLKILRLLKKTLPECVLFLVYADILTILCLSHRGNN
jgi:hypothetical protein